MGPRNKHNDILYRVNNDTNGNPRYVCHYLELDDDYNKAHKKALELGGKKYTAKWFGGGFVFQSYNTDELTARIKEMNVKNPECIPDGVYRIYQLKSGKQISLRYQNNGVLQYTLEVRDVNGSLLNKPTPLGLDHFQAIDKFNTVKSFLDGLI